MTESNATIEARLLVNALKPKYPLDIAWLSSQVLGKPVIIDERDFPINVCAMILDKPVYTSVHICVNSNRPLTSRRFAVAHELAHIYLGHQGDISIIEEEEDPFLHTEADNFATEILAPKNRMLALAQKYREPMDLIHYILRGYKVSLEMACRRLVELEVYKGAFMCFSESQPLFAYNTPGVNLNIEKINSIPVIKRGCLICQKETIDGVPARCYIRRFKSGNFLIAWIEEKPETLYKLLSHHRMKTQKISAANQND
ncbi:ImmA/IrrE family metallo-endopeptidase [Desulfocucumis palustris]|uniref:ImmA/IrrE family metallo-endopeptidase n=1 Tax=Desulfocucumis palustris TaxID=1898651 RepID=UPI0013FDF7D4|nr:ImmA/IrrE family metallo-endopeptidase [Desulfocucumis palustris]